MRTNQGKAFDSNLNKRKFLLIGVKKKIINIFANLYLGFANKEMIVMGNDHLIEFQLIEIVIFQLIESFNNE